MLTVANGACDGLCKAQGISDERYHVSQFALCIRVADLLLDNSPMESATLAHQSNSPSSTQQAFVELLKLRKYHKLLTFRF